MISNDDKRTENQSIKIGKALWLSLTTAYKKEIGNKPPFTKRWAHRFLRTFNVLGQSDEVPGMVNDEYDARSSLVSSDGITEERLPEDLSPMKAEAEISMKKKPEC